MRRALWIGLAFVALAALASPAAACDKPQAPGAHTVALGSRPFLLYLPKGYDRRKSLALVLNLHGVWSDGATQMMRISRLARVADDEGFAVAAPNGGIARSDGLYTWNVPGFPIQPGVPVPAGSPDDERYLLDVIDEAARFACIDKARVYMTGYSGGAWLTSQMACDYADRIAAIAPVAGLRAGAPLQVSPGTWRAAPDSCRPKRPVPVIAFHGLHDPWTLYRGNDNDAWGYSVPSALRGWARLDHCAARRHARRVTRHVERIAYAGCRQGARVELYLARDGGHTWPGSVWPAIGHIDREIDADRLMWQFFSRYRLPRPPS